VSGAREEGQRVWAREVQPGKPLLLLMPLVCLLLSRQQCPLSPALLPLPGCMKFPLDHRTLLQALWGQCLHN